MSRSTRPRPGTDTLGSPGCKPAGSLLGQAPLLRRSDSLSVSPNLEKPLLGRNRRGASRLALQTARIPLSVTHSALLWGPQPGDGAVAELIDPDQGSGLLSPTREPATSRLRRPSGTPRPGPTAPFRSPPASAAPTHLHELVLVKAEILGAPRQVHLLRLHDRPRPGPARQAQRGGRTRRCRSNASSASTAPADIGGAGQSVRQERRGGEQPPRQRPLEGSGWPCRLQRAKGATGISKWRGGAGGGRSVCADVWGTGL